jgi:preprotein translocase subunit YajC
MTQFLYLLQAQSGASNISFYVMIGGFVVIFYFFMYRPQQKKQKEAKSFRESLKKGDTVVTIGGLHGKIYSIDTDTVQIEVDNKGTKLTFQIESISTESTKKAQAQKSSNIDLAKA